MKGDSFIRQAPGTRFSYRYDHPYSYLIDRSTLRAMPTQAVHIAAFATAVALAASPAVQAAKPSAKSPVRQALVAAIRHHPTLGPALSDSTLDIRRIWASDKYGFVCLLPVSRKDHAHQQQGDAYVVQQIVLIKNAQTAAWQAVAHIDGLSESSKHVQCASDPQGQITDEFLEGIVSNPSMAL